ncbi:MAG: HAD family phosphatase [Holophaga sp.]|nr:HAD family phosphatase [Holophaga sp.]
MADHGQWGRRAILFDLGGVLLDWDPRHVYRSLFADEADMERFLAVVCHADWNRRIDAGRPFAEAILERQREVPEFAELIGFWRSRWEGMLKGEIPGTVAILRELKDLGVPLYALSNWSAETFPIARARFGFLAWFERIVVSGEEGLAKPDPALFQRAIERCGLVPARTLFIDDSPANIEVALGLGFDPILFTGAQPLREALAARGLALAPG